MSENGSRSSRKLKQDPFPCRQGYSGAQVLDTIHIQKCEKKWKGARLDDARCLVEKRPGLLGEGVIGGLKVMHNFI